MKMTISKNLSRALDLMMRVDIELVQARSECPLEFFGRLKEIRKMALNVQDEINAILGSQLPKVTDEKKEIKKLDKTN